MKSFREVKKFRSCLSFCLAILMVTALSLTTFAYSSKKCGWEFQSNGTTRAGVNGKKNGVFYNLNKGTVTLSIRDADNACTGGTYNVGLYIADSWTGNDTYRGSYDFESEPGAYHEDTYDALRSSDRYYLVVSGTGWWNWYIANGTVSQ